MKKRQDLKYFQKQLYNYLKNKALSYEEVSMELKEYRKQQRRYFNKSFTFSSLEELFQAIQKSQVTYLGDFHTFDQSGRNLERLLRKLTQQISQLVLGVEIVEIKYQKYIDHYLQGHITELEFLESIDYKNSWRFPWTYYRKFFDLSKQEGWRIIALNSEGTLDQRDKNAAKIIAQNLNQFPESKMLVLFGELHILPEKMPKQVARLMHPTAIRQTIIHQNIDQIYWKIKQADDTNLALKQIIKFNDQEYSLQTSPPWIKYESMIYWYENFCADPEFDLHEYILETGSLTLDGQAPDNFAYIVSHIAKTLGLQIDPGQAEDFNLYDYQNLDFLIEKVENNYKEKDQDFVKNLLTRGIPFKFPSKNEYYCSSYSINRFAYLAGLHLHSILQNNSEDELLLLHSEDDNAAIIYYIYQHASGYLASKLINPYRKCDLYLDFIEKAQAPHLTKNEQKNYLKAKQWLDEILGDASNSSLFLSSKHGEYIDIFLIGKHLGYFLGEMAFEFLEELSQSNQLDIEVVQNIYTKVNKNLETFTQDLKLFIGSKDYSKLKKRPF